MTESELITLAGDPAFVARVKFYAYKVAIAALEYDQSPPNIVAIAIRVIHDDMSLARLTLAVATHDQLASFETAADIDASTLQGVVTQTLLGYYRSAS